MKLFFSDLSPYARQVRILLEELDLTYEEDRLDKMRPIEDIGEINPNLAVPILEDQELTLFDSKVICTYLLETYGSKLPRGHQEIRFSQNLFSEENKWQDLKVSATLETLHEALVSLFLYGREMEAAGIDPETLSYHRRHHSRVDHILDWLDGNWTPDGYAPGKFTYQDLALVTAFDVARARALHNMGSRTNLKGAYKAHSSRASIEATKPA